MSVPIDPPARDAHAAHDIVGRKQPHRLTCTDFVRAMPHLASLFGPLVPAEAVQNADGGVAEVACTCRARTTVFRDAFADCAGGCGRTFWNAGRGVRVCYDPDRIDSPDASRTLRASETST